MDKPLSRIDFESFGTTVALQTPQYGFATDSKQPKQHVPISAHDLIVDIDADTGLKDRAHIRRIQQHSVLSPIAMRHPGKRWQVGRAVWWWLWIAVFCTLIIVASLYHHEHTRHALSTNQDVWIGIGVAWFVVTLFAYFGWIEGRGVWTQATFVLVAVFVQGTVLATFTSLYFHRVGMFAVVFFMYLLTAQALSTLCSCSGDMPSVGTFVYLILAFVLVAGLVVPLHNASDGWIAYPYGPSTKWLEPPLPVWQAYLGALMATIQMLVVSLVYTNLTRKHDESQTLFITGRLYLVVVYGWWVMWYTLATRGYRAGVCLVTKK
jgi:hypothetical protein